ncbi:type II toxin-antitoxin system VapB family antitoxin [Shewanella bicestrii]
MSSASTRVFTSNKNQCVRLSKAVAFPPNVLDVEVVIQGNTRVIIPAGASWAEWFNGPLVSQDFMGDRVQPTQEREGF